MWWFYGIIAVAASIGFMQGFSIIRRNRRPLAYEGASVAWVEAPVAPWHQDGSVALFLVLHSSSVLLLATLGLLMLRPQFQGGLPAISTGLSVGGIAWMAGGILAFPASFRLAPPFPMSLFSNAVVRGQFVAEWSYFSHFVAQPTTGLIRLYSAKTPEVANVAWRPSSPEVFTAAVAFLEYYLPSQRPPTALAWYQRRSLFIVATLLITIPAVLLGVLLYSTGAAWLWAYYPLAGGAMLIAGSMIIRAYQVG